MAQGMADTIVENPKRDLALGLWLCAVIAMLFIIIVVGGLTRLTDSGLSIVDWRPVTGTIPPLTEQGWQEELEKYRQIPEYQLQNRGMSMSEFQFIFWWEWGHRFLGRVIGLVFFVPFVFFWLRGMLRRDLNPRLLVLFALGGLQGFIGWWMVSSGLTERVDVSHYRLATHLGMAFIILGLAWWTMQDAFAGKSAPAPWRRWDGLATIVVVATFIQILLGALVSGLDAGRIFNSWPLMEGQFVPRDYGALSPWYVDAFENRASVQFHHRMGAYILFGLGLFWAWRLFGDALTRQWGVALAIVLTWQVVLGIGTLVMGSPLWAAALHQFSAAVLFVIVIGAWRARAMQQAGEPSTARLEPARA
jgi:cytochrome c oxidase assembly protein subunit 15